MTIKKFLILSFLCSSSIFASPPVFISVNEKIPITLQSNAGTGYGWYVESIRPSYLKKFVSLQELDKKPLDPGLPGGLVENTWIFNARKKGRYEITFVYKRLWEKNVRPVKTKKFIINVDN